MIYIFLDFFLFNFAFFLSIFFFSVFDTKFYNIFIILRKFEIFKAIEFKNKKLMKFAEIMKVD